ncbi:MAG: FecR domain-containing protein [Spirochaetes bacterium]|nr:FecR domain-containing protein [Spirochaetota bacterium]MBN2770201.1 FecR domain-containing protein [Spirochaetota bacterium]
MKSLIKEYTLPFFNLIAIIIAAFLLYLNYTYTLTHSSTVQIGTIIFKQKIAERRYSQQVIWEGITNNSPIYNFDAIRTDKGALAVIELDNGTSIQLEEETMIIIQQSDLGLDIDFENGSINAQKSDDDSSLNIRSGDTVVAVNDGSLNVNKNADTRDLNLNVSSGTAALNSGGKISQIDSTKIVNISSGEAKIGDKQIILQSPAPAKTFITASPLDINFNWTSSKESTSNLQISKDKNFNNIMYTVPSATGKATARLENGTYYWRVTLNGTNSETRRISVIRETTPVILRPLNGQSFNYTKKPPVIIFKWNGADTATQYTVEIARMESMNTLHKSINSLESFISVSDLQPGKYYCRLKARYALADRKHELLSPVISFTVNQKSQLDAPKLLSPVNTLVNANKKPTVFNWQPVGGAGKYKIAISGSAGPLFSAITTSNYFAYNTLLDPGDYTWSVTAMDTDGAESQLNNSAKFTVSSTGKITTISPSSSSRFKTGEAVNLTWRDENNGNNYLVIISKNSLFATTYRERKVSSRFTTFSDLESGNYYWKVYLLNDDDRRLIASNSDSFSIYGNVVRPIPVSPINTKFPHDTSSISLRWKPVPDATHYEIEIYQESSLISKLLKRATTASTSYSLNIASYAPGSYSWKVRSIQKSGSVIVTSSDFSKEVFTKESLKEPKKKEYKIEILNPSKIYIE